MSETTQTNATGAATTNGLCAAADRAHEDAGLVRFASAIDWTPPVGSGRALSADVMAYERLQHFKRAHRDDDDGDLYEFNERPARYEGD